MKHVDFGLTARDYAAYRAGFPDSLYTRLAAYGVRFAGRRVLDLGTGTGSLARGLTMRGSHVVGLDIAKSLIHTAQTLDRDAQVRNDYLLACAEAIGFAMDSFDMVIAGQCWHWFQRAQAASEAFRILRPGAPIVIAHFDWLPLAGNLVEATEDLILAYNPEWNFARGTGLYPHWLSDLAQGGFSGIETFSYDLEVPYTPQAWRGRIRASAGVGAFLSLDQVAAFDLALEQLLATLYPDSELMIPHRVFAVVARKPGDAVKLL